MSKLLSLLKSASSEVSLLSRLGQWMQAVSSAIDDVVTAAETTYIEVRRATTDQTVNFTNGDVVVLNAVSVSGAGIGYDAATGIFTLQSAGLYELEFYGTWVNFGTPNATAATVQWTDLAGNALVVGQSTWVVSATSTLNDGSQPVAKVLYQAAAGAQVEVKANSIGGGGTADLLRGVSYAIVRKIG